MIDVITIGSAAKDIFVAAPAIKRITGTQFPTGKGAAFPIGSKIDIEHVVSSIGGGAPNTAVTVANLGLKAAVLSAVGKDEAGAEVKDFLKKKKISTKFLYEIEGKSTSTSIIMSLGKGDRTIFRYKGAKDSLADAAIPWKSLKAKWFYINHLEDNTARLLPQIIDFAKANGITLFFNPGSTQFDMKERVIPLLKKIDVFMVNQEEASYLTKIPYQNKKEIFKQLDEWVQGIVIMTKGPKGVEVSNGKTVWSAGVLALPQVVDRTGAGDAFGSAFVAALVRQPNDIEHAIQVASANATGVLTEWGATNGLLKKGDSIHKWGKLAIKRIEL